MQLDRRLQVLPVQVCALMIVYVVMTSALNAQPPTKWFAPDYADEITNPLTDVTGSASNGKELFMQLCSVCHGDQGKGDGLAGMTLNPRPTNLRSEQVQEQSDGAIYWKLAEGRAPMASYKEVLTETQLWQLVNFIRTLK